MATKKEVKLVKKSEHTETKTQKAGSATLSVKVKSAEQEVEVKLVNKVIEKTKYGNIYKANLAYINSKKELKEAVEEYYDEMGTYDALQEQNNWDDVELEEFLYDDDMNLKNINYIEYYIRNNIYVVQEVFFVKKIVQEDNEGKISEEDINVTDNNISAIETEEVDKEADKGISYLDTISYKDVIDKLLESVGKEKAAEYKKIKTKSRKIKAKSGRTKWRKISESLKSWENYAEYTKTEIDKIINGSDDINPTNLTEWQKRVLERHRKGIKSEPYAWSPSTGFSHHLPNSEKEREYNKAYNEAKKQERAENRKAANENLAFVKSQYQIMQRIVQNQAYKQIQEIKRAKGYKFDVSALPLPPMPNIKLPQVQVTEWAGKEIFTPLLDPLAQKSKVVIEVEGDETGKKNFIRRPPDLSGLRNVKKGDYKISRNYFKAGCTLEFYPCLVAATYFQILVALTPIDEEYTYTKSEFHSNEKELIRNIRQMGRKINKKNMIQKYNELKQTYGNERNNYKGLTTQLQTWETKREIHHKIDNDIVRADWVLKFRGKEFKAFKSSRSGSYIEFEEDWFASYADQDSIYKIAGVIYDNVKDLDDFSQGFDCINLNPRKDMLEYGGYNAPTTEEHGLLTRRIGTRYHFEHGVTNKGYVYQAPAGFERITEDYYIKCLQANRGFATKFINTCTTDKYKGLQTKKQFMDENSKMFRRLKKLDPTLGAEFKPKGE